MDFVVTPNASPEMSPQDTPYPTIRTERAQEVISYSFKASQGNYFRLKTNWMFQGLAG